MKFGTIMDILSMTIAGIITLAMVVFFVLFVAYSLARVPMPFNIYS